MSRLLAIHCLQNVYFQFNLQICKTRSREQLWHHPISHYSESTDYVPRNKSNLSIWSGMSMTFLQIYPDSRIQWTVKHIERWVGGNWFEWLVFATELVAKLLKLLKEKLNEMISQAVRDPRWIDEFPQYDQSDHRMIVLTGWTVGVLSSLFHSQ